MSEGHGSNRPATELPRTELPRTELPRTELPRTELPRTELPSYVRDIARSEVLHRHARLTRNGRPVFCAPSQAEIRGAVIPRQGRGTDGKVIYPTREAAEAAARELEALGARPLRSYLCGRSRSGHFHLASDGAALATRTLHERIPQQRRPLSA